MNTTAVLMQDAVDKALTDLLTPKRRQKAELGAWYQTLWPVLDDLGLPGLLLAENSGGSGVSLQEAFGVIETLGRFALPCPLAETIMANKLLADNGLGSTAHTFTLAPARPGDTLRLRLAADGAYLNGVARAIPWAQQVDAIVFTALTEQQPVIGLIESVGSENIIRPGKNLAAEPHAAIRFDDFFINRAAIAEIKDITLVWRCGAMLRAAQISGALSAALALTVGYTSERRQFGRPLAKFQAIQQQLAAFAAEATAASTAARRAFPLIGSNHEHADFAIAAAKIYAGRAASQGAAIAHQAHGAIGFTEEYSLQRLTRRLWAWREEFGNESWWAEKLGQKIAAHGADALWPTLCADFNC